MINTVKKFSAAAGLAIGLGCAASTAVAAPVQITLEQTLPGTSPITNVFGTAALYDDVSIVINGESNYVYAGAFDVKETGTSNTWQAFCIDLFQNYGMPTTFDVSDSASTAAITTRLNKLFTNYLADVTTKSAAAGFQVAVWEIVSDVALDLTSGAFKLTSWSGNDPARNKALDYLDELDSKDGGAYTLSFLSNAEVQDLVIGDLTPVPLPAGGLLLLTGLGGLVVMRRRKAHS